MPGESLPDALTLARLVSNVTQTMCGISFEPAAGQPPDPALCWKIAWLPLTGRRPIKIALSSDQAGCAALGAALFSCPEAELDVSMIDDSLRELLNMAAGQIKGALAEDQALGLPQIMAEPDLSQAALTALHEGVVLRSRGAVSLLIWITESESDARKSAA